MPGKRLKRGEIVSKLCQVEMLQSLRKTAVEAIRSVGVTQVTYYRWSKEFGDLNLDLVKYLKEHENQYARLRCSVSDLTQDKMILIKAAKGTIKTLTSSRLHRPCSSSYEGI